jgi:ribosomal protein S18 acetylase RimI-like enzyme
MDISIRAFSDTDLNTADVILQAAFERADSWLRELGVIRKLQSVGAFLAYYQDTPAGVVVSHMYPDFTYVGPLGVHPKFQRLGIGFALMERVLEWLEARGVICVALDASPAGQPIYEKLGFVVCGQVNIFQRQGIQPVFQLPTEVQPLSLQNLDLVTATDKLAFGTDRSRLLQTLLDTYPKRGFISGNDHGSIKGYLIAQEKYIGPWVSRKQSDAELLLKAALSIDFDSGPISVIVPEENTEAEKLLRGFGFERVRVLQHMLRGTKTPAGKRASVYGQVSPSLG